MSTPTHENPFQSPVSSGEDRALVTSGVAEKLRQTRPWVLFLAIVGVISMGFMLLGMLGMAAGAATGAPGMGPNFLLGMVALYGAMIVGYMFPIVYMFKYAGRIQSFVLGGDPAQLERALAAQKGIWKSVGIVMILGFLMYIVFMVYFVANIGTMAPPTGAPAAPATAPVSVEPVE